MGSEMPALLELVVIGLAVEAVVSCWFDGDIFDSFKPSEENNGFFARLLKCPFCFTYHAALWIIVLYFLSTNVFPTPYDTIGKALIYWLAIVSVGHWLRDLHEKLLPKETENDADGS